MPGRVQHGCHLYCLRGLMDFVDHPVGKALGITPADVFDRMSAAVEQRVFRQRIPDPDDFLDKLRAQSGLPAFLPVRRLGNILFDSRSELDAPAHLQRRDRSRAFISSSDTAEAGASRKPLNRDSTNDSSASLKGGSSSSMARRMSSCRCSKVNAGSSWRTSVKLMATI